MKELISAYTKFDQIYPGYINVSKEDGYIILTIRGDPKIRTNSMYICGYEIDRGRPGRCTPGDMNCNNYCNLAPEKGPMVDSPKECSQTFCGETVSIKLSESEWETFKTELLKKD